MQIIYGERWHTKQMAPIFPLTEDEARARHESGELYTAAMGDPRAPKLVELFLKEGYVGVRWLHPLGRNQLSYDFRRIDDRLFLSCIDHNTINDAGKVVEVDSTRCKPDGTVQVQVFNNLDGTVKTGVPMSKDVTMLWEAIPEFGEYGSISRRDR